MNTAEKKKYKEAVARENITSRVINAKRKGTTVFGFQMALSARQQVE